MINLFQNIRDFIINRVSFLIMFLTYNWNILCNLLSAYISRITKYRSWMSVLSKLNVIEICAAEKGYSKEFVNYRLYVLVTNNSSPILKLVDLLQIAVDVHHGCIALSGNKMTTKTKNLHISQSTPPCV